MSERFLKGLSLYSSPDGRVKVHRGLDLSHNRQSVALKYQLHSSMSEANLVLREAFNQARLSHPNICRIIDCEVREMVSGQMETLLAMEMMEEGDLMREIERRMRVGEKWREAEILTILEKVLLALSFAQGNGICHRDIKPQNLFLSPEDTIKVGDFGSSASLTDLKLASSFTLQGSPFYMSPELKLHYIEYMRQGKTQVQHDPFKSDIYSLGVLGLFIARLKQPMELGNLDKLEEKTRILVKECGEYPKVQKVLREMLEINPKSRISITDSLKMLRSFKNPHYLEEIIENPPDSDQISPISHLCLVCKQPLTAQNAPNSSFLCSLACEKRLKAAGFCKCLACDVLRNHIPKSALPIALPCGHFFHDFACLYRDFEAQSEGFRVKVPYKCSYCKEIIPMETLEEVFCERNSRYFGGNMRKCAVCRAIPGVFVLKCGHVGCQKCSSSVCPCAKSACVLS